MPAVALPALVVKCTVTVNTLGLLRVTGKIALITPLSPSTTLVLLIVRLVVSSSIMVPTPVSSPMVVPAPFCKRTVKVSFSSTKVSLLLTIAIVWLMTPGAKVNAPLCAT
jgi:hypothetical protein